MQIVWRHFFSKCFPLVWRVPCIARVEFNNKTLHFHLCHSLSHYFHSDAPFFFFFSISNSSTSHDSHFSFRIYRATKTARDLKNKNTGNARFFFFSCSRLIFFIADRHGATFHRRLYNNTLFNIINYLSYKGIIYYPIR